VVAPSATPPPVPLAPGAPPSNRLVQRAATLALSTRVATFGAVANDIVADSEQLGAIVQQSDINVQGAQSYATFSLQTPSAGLSALLARLARLASVQSLDTAAQDITDAYGTATDHLAASRRERDGLFAALARATTTGEVASLHDRIDALTGQIGAEERTVASLRHQGNTATVAVTLQPSGASVVVPVRHGRIHDALHTAGDVLTALAAAVIVALAVIAPLALLALAAWAAARAVRRRGRERALEHT
jgi:hypothetical protein